MEGYYIKRIGQNKGKPRVWLDAQAVKAGFLPGQKYDIDVQGQTIVLQANRDGSRVVSSKRNGEKLNPVIDLNSRELLAIFDGMASVRVLAREGEIVILPLASELKKQERYKRLKDKLEAGEPLTMGSLSHGGGVLSHAIHSGLEAAGIRTELAFANDIREELLVQASEHNDAWSGKTKMLAAPMQELAFDERGLAEIPKVEVMELGLPCSGASKAGASKRGLEMAESHPEVGHLVVSALIILNKCNAAVIIGENVPEYAHSASAEILRHQLRDLGYAIQERILNGNEWGELENRNRWCFVAVTHGLEFDFDQLMPPKSMPRVLGDVLDKSISPDDSRWRSFDYLKSKEVRDEEKGNGFSMQVLDETATSVPVLRKGYAKGGSTDALLNHPSDPNLLRQFTPEEHAAIKGAPAHLVEGLSATIAHQVLGQGIVYTPFRDVGQHVGNALNRFAGRPEVEMGERPQQDRNDDAESQSISNAIASLAGEVVATFAPAETSRGRYVGEVVAVDRGMFIQDVGRSKGIVHHADMLEKTPKLGQVVRVTYDKGKGQVEERERSQLSLEW